MPEGRGFESDHPLLWSARSEQAERPRLAMRDVRGEPDHKEDEPTVEAVHPGVAAIPKIADREHLDRADERQGERPRDVPPVPPPAAERNKKDEHLGRMKDGAADRLVGIQCIACAENPGGDEVELQGDSDKDDNRQNQADPDECPPHLRDNRRRCSRVQGVTHSATAYRQAR
jgi:hypothetical protein